MIMVAGGTPGSGSSLFANMINRHSRVFCGPETSLFARPQLIYSWDTYKRCLYGWRLRKLKNMGWHRYYGTNLLDPEYGISRDSVRQWIDQSERFRDFALETDSFLCDRSGTKWWVEKTPNNVYSFGLLCNELPGLKTVLTVRDPYDTIASLIYRGFGVGYATAMYLMNVSAGLAADRFEQLVIRYEHLVRQPESVLQAFCAYSGIEYEREMIIPEAHGVKMRGWLNDETGQVSQSSIGRFDGLPEMTQEQILASVEHMRISSSFRLAGCPLAIRDIAGLCRELGYPVRESGNGRSNLILLCKELKREKRIRWWKGYHTGGRNFPVKYA